MTSSFKELRMPFPSNRVGAMTHIAKGNQVRGGKML
jgi:hypothetical protein